MDTIKILCFPYAGGSSSVFLKWEKFAKGRIRVIPVDPPGRGRRMAEPLTRTVDEAVNDLMLQVLELIDEQEEYAVYGHSMGSLLIYELLHKLLEIGFKMPVHVFLSGKNPPDVPIKESISCLNTPEFIEKILDLGGMDANFFNNPTLEKLFIPILKQDFEMIETYVYKEKKQKLPVEVSFFFSSDDASLDISHVKHWRNFITGYFNLYYFEGGHFFIFDNVEKITEIITKELTTTTESVPV